MPTTAVRGKGGSGKNTIVAWLCAKYFKDIMKYTNFPFNLPNVKQISALELFDLEESIKPVIAIRDEAYADVGDKRNSLDDGNIIKSYIPLQARKNNLSLIIIEQQNLVDVRYRDATEALIQCKDRKIYERDFTLCKDDFHYRYIKGRKGRDFTLPYSEAKKVFGLFPTNRKIFPENFEEMKRKEKLKNPDEKIKEIHRIAGIIKDDIEENQKITHDLVKYLMLKNKILDFTLESYVYVLLKGEVK